ncbi:MAG: hypothetical protein HY831_03105 [Candidatus Aenigmarchaeota archaeon]|nr:hypothetical protein [Candidatus Aenigmarchaeota archaeon]
MSLLTKLRNKVVGRRQEVQEADFETVRSAILGEQAPPVNTQPIEPSWKQRYPQNSVPKEFEQPSLDMPNEPEIRQPYSQSFSREVNQPQQIDDRHKWDKRDMYELFDRLGIIEAQLAAIRSQSETINERLKMLDIKLTRRY